MTGHLDDSPSSEEFQGVALSWASEVLEFMQQDAIAYERYRRWQLTKPDRKPDDLVLTQRNLRGAEMVILLISLRLFGVADPLRIAALSLGRPDDTKGDPDGQH
jgi:hypothetical protein